jgi:hypothetical protein
MQLRVQLQTRANTRVAKLEKANAALVGYVGGCLLNWKGITQYGNGSTYGYIYDNNNNNPADGQFLATALSSSHAATLIISERELHCFATRSRSSSNSENDEVMRSRAGRDLLLDGAPLSQMEKANALKRKLLRQHRSAPP